MLSHLYYPCNFSGLWFLGSGVFPPLEFMSGTQWSRQQTYNYVLVLLLLKWIFCPAFPQAEKKTNHAVLAGQHFCPLQLWAGIMASIQGQGPEVYRMVNWIYPALSLLWFLGTTFKYPGVCVWLGLNKHSGILFWFLFVLKSGVLRGGGGGGSIPVNLDPI